MAVPNLSEQNTRFTDRIPAHAFFLVSAVFHYLGPAFAVLLFAHVPVLGVNFDSRVRMGSSRLRKAR